MQLIVTLDDSARDGGYDPDTIIFSALQLAGLPVLDVQPVPD